MKDNHIHCILFFYILLSIFHSPPLKAQVAEYPPRLEPFSNNVTFGFTPGVMVYSGDVDEIRNNFGMELFCRYPLKTAEDAALYFTLGYSKLQGSNEDANDPSRTFTSTNPFSYALFMPSYKLNSDDRVAVWLKVGIGAGYLKSVNPKTEGAKLLFPVSVDFNYHFSQQWIFVTNVTFMFSGGDLDGIRRGDNPNYQEKDNLINVYMGFGFMP